MKHLPAPRFELNSRQFKVVPAAADKSKPALKVALTRPSRLLAEGGRETQETAWRVLL